MKAPTDAAIAKQRERVAEIRARGPRPFIIRRGILGFGVPWALAMAAAAYFGSSDEFSAPFMPSGMPRWLGWLLFVLPFGLVAGAWWGRSMWRTFEKKNWFLPPEASDGSRPAA